MTSPFASSTDDGNPWSDDWLTTYLYAVLYEYPVGQRPSFAIQDIQPSAFASRRPRCGNTGGDGESELEEARALRSAHITGALDAHMPDLAFYGAGILDQH